MAMDLYFSGQGIAYVAARDANGKPQKLIDLGDAAECKIAMKTETMDVNESRSGQRLLAKRVPKAKSADLSLTLKEHQLENLALGAYGTVTTKASGTVTGEALPSALVAGDRVALANAKVSAVVLKDSAGTPATLVAGTNYTVDADAGHIVIVNPAAFTQPFKADYSYGGSKKLGAFTQPSPERWIQFEGVNTADNNRRVRVCIFKVVLDPFDELGLIHEEMSKLTLKGAVLMDDKRLSTDPLGQFFSYEYMD